MTDKELQKTKRQRSPGFPYYPLSECVEFIRMLHKADKLNRVPVNIALGRMGLTSSSPATRGLAALLSYGLLEDEGVKGQKRVWLSDLAKRIILDKRTESPDRERVVRDAALSPPMMREVWKKWQAGLPSRDTIESDLKLDMGFTERAAGRFASVIRNNFAYAKLVGYYEPLEDDMEAAEDNEEIKDPPGKMPKDDVKYGDYSFPISDKRNVYLKIPRPVTEEDLQRIIEWINVMTPGLLEEENDDIPF